MSPASSARNVVGLVGAFAVASVVMGVVAAGLAVPALGTAGQLTNSSLDFFNSLPSDFQTPPQAAKSVMLDATGHRITTFYEENRVPVPLSKISMNMQNAIIAIEDERFYEHGGIDPKGLSRAALVNAMSGHDSQGASTLTEQYVRNVEVEEAYARGDSAGVIAARAKDKSRKIKDIRYAITLDNTKSKGFILAGYLNIAAFSNRVNGVEAAAEYYFNTTAAKLTVPQAATLAGVVQRPTYYNPKNHPDHALARRNTVLEKMLAQKKITQPVYNAARASKLGLHIRPARQGCASAGYKAYFCDYVYQQIVENPAFAALGETSTARKKAIDRGGLIIRTTQNPTITNAAWHSTIDHVEAKNKVATATVTVQPGTGKVLSIAQNKYYAPTPHPRNQNTSINYAVDYKYGGSAGFPTGSTFKPFTLATWLKAGKSLNATVSSATGAPSFSEFHSCVGLDRSQNYPFLNSEGKGTGKGMTVADGTAQSVNGVFISMEKQLNLCDIRATAEDLGVHLASPRTDICSTKRPQPETTRLPACVPSLTLGPENISPMTMAAAYAGFAAQGKFCTPIVITSITDRNHKQFAVPKSKCDQGIPKNIANTVTKGLSRVLTNGTAARVRPLPDGRQASGKTGTTNGSMDTWFVGYTPQLATSVWVGDPNLYPVHRGGKLYHERKDLRGRTIHGIPHGSVFGADIAAPIWKQIMLKADKGLPKKNFPPADPKLTVSPKTKVPDVDHQKVSAAIKTLEDAGFTTTVSTTLVDSDQPAGTVTSTSPGGGSSAAAGTEITINVSSGKPDKKKDDKPDKKKRP